MAKSWKTLLALLMCALLVLSVVACASVGTGDDQGQTADVGETTPTTTDGQSNTDQTANAQYKIAFLFPGLINDNGWNATAYRALETMKELGYETAYTESVKVDSIEETFRNYADAGYNILVGHGFEFGEPALMLASQYPDVNFCITGKMPDGMTEASNVSFVEYKEYEAAYVAGMFAAGVSKTGKLGFITGETNPTQLAGLAAFTNGARYINPDVTIMAL